MERHNQPAHGQCIPLETPVYRGLLKPGLADAILDLEQHLREAGAPGEEMSLREDLHQVLRFLSQWRLFHDHIERYKACHFSHPVQPMWSTLHQDEGTKAGLLCIDRNSPVPMHDHPGSAGVQMLLCGEVSLEQFNPESTNERSVRAVKLRRHRCATLHPGNISYFTATAGNIHHLHSRTRRSILLCLLIRPYQEAQRAWYFPLETDQGRDNSFHASFIRHRN